APNPHREWSYDYGSARRVAQLCGTRVTWFNLFEREPERWSEDEAREAAETWCLDNGKRPRRIPLLLLGTKVCNAFGIEDIEWLESYASQLWSPMIAFPHPSGLNRWWNEPENERRARRLARAVVQGTYFAKSISYIKDDGLEVRSSS